MANENAALRLRAFDLADLGVLSSMVQDALVPAVDMVYLPDARQFVLALNRFCWETADNGPPYWRCHAGLRFDNVTGVARRNVVRGDADRMLSLLAIAYDDGVVMLTFSGGAAVRLTVTDLVVALQDLDEAWPTQWKPEHDPDAND